MGKFLDQFKGYDVEGRVSEAESIIDRLIKEFKLDAADLEYYDRFRIILKQLHIKYRITDPYMFTVTQVYEIDELLRQISQSLQGLNAETFNSSIENTSVLFDRLVDKIHSIPSPGLKKEVVGYNQSVIKFKELVETYISQIEEQHKQIQDSVEQTSTTIAEEKNKYVTLITELREAIETRKVESADLIETLETNMGIKLSSLKGEADSQFNTYVNSMDEKIKKFTEDIKVATDDLNEKMDTEYKEINKKWEQLFSQSNQEFIDQKESYLGQWKKHISDIESVAGALAEHSMAYSFKKIADDEKKSKDNWNVGTIIGFIIILIYGISLFYISFKYPFTWENLIGRLSLVIGLGAFIAYSARRVSIHGRVERYCRETEIELASLGPYFAEFKDKPDEVLKIRLQLAEKFFGKGDIISGSFGSEQSRVEDLKAFLSPELFKLLIELAKKIK